jgi:hypothetical protein
LAAAVDGDGLRDGDRSKATGIECIDLASGCRFRNGSGKGFARRRASAWIGVVADA